MTTQLQLTEMPGPVMWVSGKQEQEPKLKVWVNTEPKPALMVDEETGKPLHVKSFAEGDALVVKKPAELALTKTCNLYVLGYGYDETNELYAIVPGKVPAKFRTAAEQPKARETVFKPPLPDTVQEIYVRQYSGAFTLQRYKYQPEVNPVTKQILIDFKAA